MLFNNTEMLEDEKREPGIKMIILKAEEILVQVPKRTEHKVDAPDQRWCIKGV